MSSFAPFINALNDFERDQHNRRLDHATREIVEENENNTKVLGMVEDELSRLQQMNGQTRFFEWVKNTFFRSGHPPDEEVMATITSLGPAPADEEGQVHRAREIVMLILQHLIKNHPQSSRDQGWASNIVNSIKQWMYHDPPETGTEPESATEATEPHIEIDPGFDTAELEAWREQLRSRLDELIEAGLERIQLAQYYFEKGDMNSATKLANEAHAIGMLALKTKLKLQNSSADVRINQNRLHTTQQGLEQRVGILEEKAYEVVHGVQAIQHMLKFISERIEAQTERD